MVGRFDPATYFADQPSFLTSWGWQSGWYYFTLRPGTDPAVIAPILLRRGAAFLPAISTAGMSGNAAETLGTCVISTVFVLLVLLGLSWLLIVGPRLPFASSL